MASNQFQHENSHPPTRRSFLQTARVWMTRATEFIHYPVRIYTFLVNEPPENLSMYERFLQLPLQIIRKIIIFIINLLVGVIFGTKPKKIYQAIHALIHGEYELGTTRQEKIQTILGILYLLSPIDIIPDWIPVIGWLDDGVVLYFVATKIYHVIQFAMDVIKAHEIQRREARDNNMLQQSDEQNTYEYRPQQNPLLIPPTGAYEPPPYVMSPPQTHLLSPHKHDTEQKDKDISSSEQPLSTDYGTTTTTTTSSSSSSTNSSSMYPKLLPYGIRGTQEADQNMCELCRAHNTSLSSKLKTDKEKEKEKKNQSTTQLTTDTDTNSGETEEITTLFCGHNYCQEHLNEMNKRNIKCVMCAPRFA